MIPDGFEPSFSGCKPGVVATGPRDQIESGLTGTRTRRVQIEKRLACDASIFLLDDESFMSSGSRGTRTHNGFHSSPVFKTGPSSSRVTSNSCGGRNRTCRLVVQSNGFLPTETTPHRAKCPAGIEPACPAWKAGTFAARPRARVFSVKRKPWGSNPQRTVRPHLLSRQAPQPVG